MSALLAVALQIMNLSDRRTQIECFLERWCPLPTKVVRRRRESTAAESVAAGLDTWSKGPGHVSAREEARKILYLHHCQRPILLRHKCHEARRAARRAVGTAQQDFRDGGHAACANTEGVVVLDLCPDAWKKVRGSRQKHGDVPIFEPDSQIHYVRKGTKADEEESGAAGLACECKVRGAVLRAAQSLSAMASLSGLKVVISVVGDNLKIRNR